MVIFLKYARLLPGHRLWHQKRSDLNKKDKQVFDELLVVSVRFGV